MQARVTVEYPMYRGKSEHGVQHVVLYYLVGRRRLADLDDRAQLLGAPPKSGSRFHNYKGTFSIILLACVDANYKFVLVDIVAEGHNSDGGVFKNSIFGQSLEKGTLQRPCPLEIPGTTNMLPFPLKNNLRPYPLALLCQKTRLFLTIVCQGQGGALKIHSE
ncbi:DDE Tnp4 domain-containing protein [Trichonephila clavipes]|uniref:DDE Tnp4 domain-containing protein n=1 Tax=Trichonephila clavipes TaxID=2585209 RepID=A0A8X6REV8_TRICX|nr:DDE Tnp4 domain-containing protein [Trichonephila clavipes]